MRARNKVMRDEMVMNMYGYTFINIYGWRGYLQPPPATYNNSDGYHLNLRPVIITTADYYNQKIMTSEDWLLQTNINR